MSISTLNAFCRRFDLVFVEMGMINGQDIFRFVDFRNAKVYFTDDEIMQKISDNQLPSPVSGASIS